MKPDFQPTLTGNRVLLRPCAADDWQGMFAAAADPLIWAGHPARNRYEEAAFREFFAGALRSRSALTILDRQTGTIIGSSRYEAYEADLNEVEIGWTFLARSAWGGLYNREVKDLMIGHAFQFVDAVVFQIAETNVRSRCAMEKIGGRRRPQTRVRKYAGIEVAHLIYEIRKPAAA